MSFLNRITEQQNDSLLRGANAPAPAIKYDALFVNRRPPSVIPNNAPAANYRGAMVGNRQMTNVQADYVDALRGTKLSGKKPEGATWFGHSFG